MPSIDQTLTQDDVANKTDASSAPTETAANETMKTATNIHRFNSQDARDRERGRERLRVVWNFRL